MAHAQKSIYGTFAKALDDANLKSLPLDLPSVVVIGNQSVGKSSLLEPYAVLQQFSKAQASARWHMFCLR